MMMMVMMMMMMMMYRFVTLHPFDDAAADDDHRDAMLKFWGRKHLSWARSNNSKRYWQRFPGGSFWCIPSAFFSRVVACSPV